MRTSIQQVGSSLARLVDQDLPVDVEKWSGTDSGGTTWLVSRESAEAADGREVMTDGETVDIVDEAKPAIVGGPHPSRIEAQQDDAIDDPDTIIMSERALELARSERPIRDERGDVDVVTDRDDPRDARLNKSKLRDLAAEQWGQQAQINKAAEECSELTAALNRRFNGQQDPANLLTKFVDARIMLWQLELLWTDAERDRLLEDLARHLGVADDLQLAQATRRCRVA